MGNVFLFVFFVVILLSIKHLDIRTVAIQFLTHVFDKFLEKNQKNNENPKKYILIYLHYF